MTIIADTGAIFALVDASDRWHEPVREWWRTNRDEILIPEVALLEITHLLQKRLGPEAEIAFIRSLADGEFQTIALSAGDTVRASELMAEYADLTLGFVDAAIAAIAERLKTRYILTTDRRHFGVLRPRHARTFLLLPSQLPAG